MKKNIKKSFIKSPLYSSKFDKYFVIYENLFQKYINKRITFVEVGVAMGGSLFMWRDYLGKKANIIITKPINSIYELPYAFGSNLIDSVFIEGNIVK